MRLVILLAGWLANDAKTIKTFNSWQNYYFLDSLGMLMLLLQLLILSFMSFFGFSFKLTNSSHFAFVSRAKFWNIRYSKGKSPL